MNDLHPLAGKPAPASLLVNVPRLVLAITEAICRHRKARGVDGPLFLGWDTHALSEPARVTVLEVLAAHDVDVRRDARDGFTPTPVASQAMVAYNRGRLYARIDVHATAPEEAALARLTAADLGITELAGERVSAVLTAAPGSGDAIGGIKVVAPARIVKAAT